MIRLLLLMVLLSSCGNLPIAYIQNFSSVNSVIFGFPEYEITQQIFDEYEYSFIKVRFGKGPHSIMVLAYVEDDVFEWVGEDDSRLFTRNGRIVKTIGLDHNFEIINPRMNIIDDDTIQYESLNLYNPDLYLATNKSSITSTSARVVYRLGDKLEALKVSEKNVVSSIAWRYKNIYFTSLDSKEVYQSEQHIHPRLPALKIEFYYKF